MQLVSQPEVWKSIALLIVQQAEGKATSLDVKADCNWMCSSVL